MQLECFLGFQAQSCQNPLNYNKKDVIGYCTEKI